MKPNDQASRRSEITRNRLMRAAEKLFAQKGLENVSVREIIKEAGQKNESAMQYHFGSRAGLIDAIHRQRNAQIQEQRTQLLQAFIKEEGTLGLRDLCQLMVAPVFQLARHDPSFRDYIQVFGRAMATSDREIVSFITRDDATGTRETLRILRGALDHLNDRLFQIRIDNTARLASLAMSQRAREKGSFRGKAAEFFLHNLLDTMAAMLAVEVSAQTRAHM
jgi:AcrR family transcriptional regulator